MISYLRFILALLLLFPFLSYSADGEIQNLEWPRKIETDQAIIVIYHPQIEMISGNKLKVRAAISVSTKQYTDPVFGTLWIDCRLITNRTDRTAILTELRASQVKFPGVSETYMSKIRNILEKEVPQWELMMTIDQLLTALEDDNGKSEVPLGSIHNRPEIIYRDHAAVLIRINGDPVYGETEDKNYQYVVNTACSIFFDQKANKYYLKGLVMWFSSSTISGGWEYDANVPKKLHKLAREMEGGGQAGEQVPDDSGVTELTIPEIIVRTKPAELILTKGDPDFVPIGGTSLLYAKNTGYDILMTAGTQQYYVLLSDSWYTGRSLTNGPWKFVAPDELTEDFAAIPPDSDIGHVRYSIPGTDEAHMAVLDNSIPQTAAIDRASATVIVLYDGEPEFEAVEGTSMQYGVNTDKSVLKVDDRYYCCDEGIWFESRKAKGPWVVCTSLPEAVKDIPDEAVVSNVKYVYIYDFTPSLVYVGYTPAYLNSSVYQFCAFDAIGQESVQGRYDQINIYASRGSGVKHTGGNTYNPRSGVKLPPSRNAKSQIHSPKPCNQENSNVITDKNGNVYRKESDSWQQRIGNQWKNVDSYPLK